MPTYLVSDVALVSDVGTLTLDRVSGLRAGLTGTVAGAGAPFDGLLDVDDVITTVDATTGVTTYTIESTIVHADVTSTPVGAQFVVPVTWATVSDVLGFLGLLPSEALDEEYLEQCVDAGNEWCYDRRYSAGYHDLPDTVPSSRVRLGAVLKCAEMYRMRGSFGSYSQYGDLETTAPANSNVEILRLLGINRPAIA